MKYIFLDFDGPLFNNNCSLYIENQKGQNQEILLSLGIHPFFHYWKMDISMINFLNNLYKNNADTNLIISSSWANIRMHQKQTIVDLLNINNLKIPLNINWTSQIYNGQRVEQIKRYLIDNNIEDNDYIVLDDHVSGWSLAEQTWVKNVFLCEEDIGFTKSDLLNIENLFLKNKKLNNKM